MQLVRLVKPRHPAFEEMIHWWVAEEGRRGGGGGERSWPEEL